jgi:tyrosine-protein kinase Etk/Wzc
MRDQPEELAAAITGESDSDESVVRAAAELLVRWRAIVATMVAAMLVAGIVSWLLPNRYTARAVLYIPQSQGTAPLGLEALAAQLPPGMLRLGSSGGSDTRIIAAFLESRTLRDSLVARYGPLRERQLRARRDMEGSIIVDITHRDPTVAASVANAVPELLNVLALRASADVNEQRIGFLRMQLDEAQDRLVHAESRLVSFQQASGAPDVEEQGRRTIEAAVELQRRVTEMEIEVAQLRRVVTPNNPRLQAAEAELAAWRAQLRRITQGSEPGDLLLSLDASPELRAEAYRLARDFRTQEQVVLSLTAALTQAQLDSRDDLPVVTVIDPATIPDEPSGPGLFLMLPVAAVLGLVVGSLIIILGTSWNAARRRPKNAPWFVAWDQFRGELRRPRTDGGRSGISEDTVNPDAVETALRAPAE